MNKRERKFPDNLDVSRKVKKELEEKFENMNEEEKQRCITQSKLQNSTNRMSQLIDRIKTDSFQ